METNVNFLLDLAGHPEFAFGNVHTNFIRDHYDSLFRTVLLDDTTIVQAVLALVLKDKSEELETAVEISNQYNPFIVEASYRVNYEHQRTILLKFKDQGRTYKVFRCLISCFIFSLICRYSCHGTIFKKWWL